MRARLISEAIKHLSPKSDEELLSAIETEPILDQIKVLHRYPSLQKKLLPFSNKIKKEIREAVKQEAGYSPPIYAQLLIILDTQHLSDTPYLDWLWKELYNELIKEIKATPKYAILEALEEAIEYSRLTGWKAKNYPNSDFPPVVPILLKKAKDFKVDILNETTIEYMVKNGIDFMEYFNNLDIHTFLRKKKDGTYSISFGGWGDFSQYFKETNDIGEKEIENILNGEGSEYFLGYRTGDDEFPEFSKTFLTKIKSIFPELKKAVVSIHKEAAKYEDIHSLWKYLIELEKDREIDDDLLYAILGAVNETIEVADENEAYNDLKEAVIKYFGISNVKYYKEIFLASITEEGAKKMVILHYAEDSTEKIKYYPPQYGWQGDPEKHPDVFIDALLDKLENI